MKAVIFGGTLLFWSATGSANALACKDRAARSPASLNPSIYYTAEVDLENATCASAERQAVPGINGLRLCPRDLSRCRLEGSCRIRDEGGEERIINYHSGGRFVTADADRCPYGYGSWLKSKAICLVPFQTVAADPRFHKPGDVLFIPSLKGLRLPRGFGVHSGYVIVGDTGGDIKGENRFDFFTGTMTDRDRSNPLGACGFGDERQNIAFEKIASPAREEVLRETGFPEYQTSPDPSYGGPLTRGRGRVGAR